MNEVTAKVVNGVNVDQLVGTIEAVKGNPEIALFKFRATNNWVKGGHSKTTIQGFYGATQEDTSRPRPFVVDGDEPAVLLGENNGPNAVEAVLHALASCLAVGIIYNGSAMGIQFDALSFELEGDLDLHCFLGLSETIRPGYQNITVKVNADSNASEEDLKGLMNHVIKTSPVLDIISNPVPVEIKF